jgi:hypothetical protein
MNENEKEDFPEQKREELASRLGKNGYDPDIARRLTNAGLKQLQTRLDERDASPPDGHWVKMGPGKTAKYEDIRPPLKYDDLQTDQARANKLEIEKLEKEETDYRLEIAEFDSQIDSIREDSEDRIPELEQTKMRMQNNLRQKQEEIARLKSTKAES